MGVILRMQALRRLLMFKSFFLCWGVSVKLYRQRESPIKKGAQKNPIKVIFCYCCFHLGFIMLSKQRNNHSASFIKP